MRRLGAYWLSLAIVIVCLLATAGVSWQLVRTIQAQDRGRFESGVERLRSAINDRLDHYVAVLRDSAAFVELHHGFTREFPEYLSRLQIQARYPGVQGVGFSARMRAADLPTDLARFNRQVSQPIRIWPESARPEYHAIVHLEPLDRRNRAALGYDMFTDPARRDAMVRARDSGQAAASAPVTLVQEIDPEKQAGFLLYVPVYEGGVVPASVEERRRRLQGFVYSPFRIGDLFAGILAEERPRVGFEIRDEELPGQLLFRTGARTNSALTAANRLEVAGRHWSATFFPLPGLIETSSAPLVPVVAWTGVGLSLLIALLVAAQTHARVRVEERDARLRETQRDLQDFVDNAAEGLHWVGADGTIVWANRAELEMLGYSADEYIGRNIADFHAHRGTIDDILHRLQGGETLTEYEAVLRCKDGSTRTVLINSNVYRLHGRFVHTRCFTRDITDRKQAELALQEALAREQAARSEAEAALRLKDEFLAALSHELRTPLNAILGRTQMLLEGAVAPERAPDALAAVRRNAEAQKRIVDDMLDVSAFIAGRVQLTYEPIDVEVPIRSAIEVLEPAAAAKRIALSLDSSGPALVLGDRARLQQVFWNLLSNAVKFTPSGGTITVHVARDGEHVRTVVKDTGAGIDRDFMPFVFDRFAQAKESRFQGGLGLGLAIVRQIVEAHGGKVSVSSAGPGQGSEFTIDLASMSSIASVESLGEASA
jgi:PAS domain S-box-containing protein